MTAPRPPDPVLLVVAAFSRHMTSIDWAREQLVRIFGPIVLESPPFDFNQTRYYEATMGAGLRKSFLVFEELVAADRLAEIKLKTIGLEQDLVRSGRYPEPRPLNLDPGLLSLGKVLLATSKDQAHRIYLRDGIYAEVTLRFQAGCYETWPWTYADYQLPEVRRFLEQAREWYRQRLRSFPL
jgi:hypothetical protein